MYIVYKHVNRINNKLYVGFTPKISVSILPDGVGQDEYAHQLMNVRWSGHCSTSHADSHLVFHKAIRKYGEDAFDHEVVEVCQTLEHVLLREVFWIKELKSTIDEHGYNMTKGGEGNVMTDKVKASHKLATSLGTKLAFQNPEIRARHRVANKIAQNKPETKLKRCASQQIAQNRPEVNAKRSATLKLGYADHRLKKDHNGEANPRARLTEENVREIKHEWNMQKPFNRGPKGEFYERFALRFNVTPSAICRLIVGSSWKHVTV